MKAIIQSARADLGGWRLQAVVIGLVVLAVGMLIDSHSPFSRSFTGETTGVQPETLRTRNMDVGILLHASDNHTGRSLGLPRAHNSDVGRGEVIAGAQHGVPGPVGECVREAVAEIERGRMPSLAVSPPAAHRPGRQVCVNRHDVDLRVTKEPVDNVLPSGPEPGLNDDAQLDADGGRHQPDEGIFKVGRKFFAASFAEDDRNGCRCIDDKAAVCWLCQRGRPASS